MAGSRVSSTSRRVGSIAARTRRHNHSFLPAKVMSDGSTREVFTWMVVALPGDALYFYCYEQFLIHAK